MVTHPFSPPGTATHCPLMAVFSRRSSVRGKEEEGGGERERETDRQTETETDRQAGRQAG